MKTLKEKARGCGFRKPGGMYLTLLNGKGMTCGRLPIPLVVCPCCGEGIRRSRSPRWIQAGLLMSHPCKHEGTPVKGNKCNLCPMKQWGPKDKVLLIWVGSIHYPSPESFLREADQMGISRRITRVPKGFEVGKTWVALAHERASVEVEKDQFGNLDAVAIPGVFHLFRPNEIQYVVKGDETEKELAAIRKRGLTPVRVIQDHGPELF